MKKTNYILSLVLILSVILTNVLKAQDQPKKKWSPVLKGGVIGAATGAVAGAVINKKNRVAGGVVGAAVGGAAGAVVGKVIDNKQKKKAAEEQQRMEQLEQVAVASAPAPENTPAPARSYASTTKKTTYKARRSAPKVVAPVEEEVVAVQPAYMQMGWILNDGNADPMVAYANSEYKRKSW